MRILCLSLLFAPFGFLAGCGDGTPDTPDVSTYTLTFNGGGVAPPLLVARDGDAPWQRVSLSATGSATFVVSAGYHGWAVVCPRRGRLPGVLRVWYESTPDPTPVVPCANIKPLVQVSGHVAPAASNVYIGQILASVAADGTFVASVEAGVHDVAVVAHGGPRMLIRRSEPFVVDRALDLDAVRDGVDATTATVTVTGADADPITLNTSFHTAGDVDLEMGPADHAARLVPVTYRVPGDRLVVEAMVGTPDLSRVARRLIDGDSVPVMDLPPGSTITGDRTGMDWSGRPEWTRAALMGSSPDDLAITVAASGAWQSASNSDGHIDWPDPATLPGWDASWPMIFPASALVLWVGSLENGASDGDFTAVASGHDMRW